MGVVYKGRDPEIGRIVAIKTLRKLISHSSKEADATLERFKTEARSAGNLRHPNIITIFEVSRDGDTPFIVMDYVEGESLDAIIARHGKLEPALMVHFLSQAAAGLDYAHSKGVIHRDIKPSNLLVDGTGNLFIADFGVASINESYSEDDAIENTQVVGTPGYMAPEQVLSEKLDKRVDLFSLGIVAFECLAGCRPFGGKTFNEVISNIINAKPRSITELVPGLPLSLEATFEKALAREPDQRFSSSLELITALKSALGIEQNIVQFVSSGDDPVPLRTRKGSQWQTIQGSVGKVLERVSPKIEPKSQPGEAQKPKPDPAPDGPAQNLDMDSSPWSARPAQIGDWHLRSAGRTELSPGDLFAHGDHVDSSRRSKAGKREQFSLLRVLTVVLVIVCVFSLVSVVWVLTGEDPIKRLPPNARPGQVGPPVVFGPIESILRDPETDPVPVGKPVVEMTNRELLGVLKSSEVSEAMLLRALKEGRERGIPHLVDISRFTLRHDSYIVRVATVKTLAEIGDRRIVPELVIRLDDHDPVVRGHTAKALGVLGDRRALGYLNVRYLKEDVAEVKRAIKKAIEKIRGYPFTDESE